MAYDEFFCRCKRRRNSISCLIGEKVTAQQRNTFMVKGLTGATGATGPRGVTGPQGLQGERGERGLQGEKGDRGDIGPKGEQGIQGEKGEKGDTGAVGPQGLQGIQGEKGEIGSVGPQGLKGDTGAKGEKGERGETGTKGATGPTGPIGPTGPKGETGSAGGGDVVARSTTLLEPMENARVETTKENDVTYFDFYIPKGKDGVSDTVRAGTVQTMEPTENANVTDRYDNGIHYLDFDIPRGVVGLQGEKGDTGPQGIKGDTGPQGEKGDRGETGPRGFPGEIGISEVITIDGTETVEFGEPAEVQDDFDRYIHHLTFYIPKGQKGDTGPQGLQGPQGIRGEKGETGPLSIPSQMIISYGDPTTIPATGLEVLSNARLPLERLELAYGNFLSLDTTNNTITIKDTGVYSVTFSTNAYVKKSGTDFNPLTDFVSIALRIVDTDDILAATNTWCVNESALNTFGQGLFTIATQNTVLELVNLAKKSVFITGCDVRQTVSQSYFSVPMVTVIITKLG